MSAGPAPTAFDPAPWNRLLEGVARRHRVPGIVAGVLRIDPTTGREQRVVAHTGVTNLSTGVPTDAHTICQVGSITKVVTATMVMQLREEGRLELDSSLAALLPELALPGDLGDLITVRHLLTHSSGLDGDLFTDTGRGDDCLERYVATLSEAESLFAPGAAFSYCNSGFVLLGRIVEVLDARTWDESLRVRVTEPLALSRFVTLPEEVVRHRASHGHIRFPGAPDWSLAPVSTITRSMGPAGLITSSTDDLLSFGAAFLRGGDAGGGRALLSPESVAEMTAEHLDLGIVGDHTTPTWGLGWMRDNWAGQPVFWHGGTTIGQNAWFQVLPHSGVALVVFCNGGNAATAAEEVYSAFAATFASTVASHLPAPGAPASSATCEERWLGQYADAGTSATVRRSEDGGLEIVLHVAFDRAHPDGQVLALLPRRGAEGFVCRADSSTPWTAVTFTEIDGAPVVYVGIRALPRRAEEEAG